MKRIAGHLLSICLGVTSLAATAQDPLPAFPGAEGSGAFAVGGRGGEVYHVSNLDDSGPGSLRYGVQSAVGPRTIVFDVSGTIELRSILRINRPYLTLAGQTAPGDGITVSGWTTSVQAHDVIIRFMRFRPGDVNCPRLQDDSLNAVNSQDVIFDHLSASWSIDETLSVTNSDRVTVQWSLITESLNNSCHAKGLHGYGSLLRYGNGSLTFHHNLYAHHNSRNPRVGDDIGLDFVNNVVYDWGGTPGYSGAADEGTTRINYVGNYGVAGPSTRASARNRVFNGGSIQTLIYQSNNLIDSNVNRLRDGVDTGWAMFTGAYTIQDTRFDFAQVATDDPQTAYDRVLADAGASVARDAVDLRILAEVANDDGGIIDSQNQVGGWPELQSVPPPLDSDQDGIPDEWELAHGLDPNDPADGAAISDSGYSNLEVYLNELALQRR